jgi:hypothetical protein
MSENNEEKTKLTYEAFESLINQFKINNKLDAVGKILLDVVLETLLTSDQKANGRKT